MEFKHLKTGTILRHKSFIFLWIFIAGAGGAISFPALLTHGLNDDTKWYVITFLVGSILTGISHLYNILAFRKIFQEYQDKISAHGILGLQKQQKRIESLYKIKESLLFRPKDIQNFSYEQEMFLLNNEIEYEKQQISTHSEKFYKIAHEIENYNPNWVKSLEEIQIPEEEINIATNKKMGELIIFYIIITGIAIWIFSLLATHISQLFVLGHFIICFVAFVSGLTLFANLKEYENIKNYIIISKKIIFMQAKIKEYFQIVQNQTQIIPESSLLFADIIENFSLQIKEKQKALENIKSLWKLFLSFNSKPSKNIQKFFENEESKILDEISFAKKSIQYFSDLEKKKLATIAEQNHQGNNENLSNKRQKILIESINNLQNHIF